MSTTQNTEWIEAAYENFRTALGEEDLPLARAIIADTQDAGFSDEAQKMRIELQESL